MSGLHEKMVRAIAAHKMFQVHDRVAVAVSGGADSMALLAMLERLSKRYCLSLEVAHFNHQLRGAESDGDEQFVRAFARKLKLHCRVERGDVRAYASAEHLNLEVAARTLRYRFFHALLESGAATKIALGHTANDQAETFLMRLLRGAGTRGLTSVLPVLEGRFVRPLIDVTREEILEFLEQERISWREDSSNHDLHFTRNRIRHELLPSLAKKYNPALVRQLAHTAEQCRIDDAYLSRRARRVFDEIRTAESGKGLSEARALAPSKMMALPIAPLRRLDRAILSRIVRLAIQEVKQNLLRIDESHYDAIFKLLEEGQSGETLDLPRGIRVERAFEFLILEKATSSPAKENNYELAVPITGRVELPFQGMVWETRLLHPAGGAAKPSKEFNRFAEKEGDGEERRGWRACFDFSKLSSCLKDHKSDTLVVRNVRPGDRYHPRGSAHSIKVFDLLSKRHLAASRRAGWPLLVAGKEIVWALGCAEAKSVAATGKSAQVLVVETVSAV